MMRHAADVPAGSPSPNGLATSTNAGLSMQAVTAGYYSHDLVLNNVSLTARPGKVTVLLGPNGSGKSTALRVLYGLLRPRSGQVRLNGQEITTVPPHRRPALGMALLPQGRSVFPELTVHENLEIGAWRLLGERRRLAAALEAIYERYPLLKGWRQKLAGSLSGGQQRLVEIARMMVADPRVILIDEPSVGLAPLIVDQVYEEIARLKEERRTILLVDQNVRAAVALADYVYTLEYGHNKLEGERGAFEDRLEALIKSWLRF
uniref:ABC transporter ATP-binding protein n=1 Tax=Thermogemmatispora argillosa TaxID=2045280 RepID=A0A455SVF0_9CHLR|nr:ABC transporter ATP-binding protein [Thermogemmatispora argillosa]